MAQIETLISGNGDLARTLVVVFLRGGADGLTLVPPVEEDRYHKLRRRLAVPKSKAVPLDEVFGLHPLLAELGPIFKEGHLAVVHAAGSEDQTRSHFEAQDLMEHGGMVAGGWLGRFLRHRTGGTGGALSAVALGRELPECLRGAPSATVLQSIDDFSLGSGSESLAQALGRLYQGEHNRLGQAATDTLDGLQRIAQLKSTPYHPEHGAVYGRDDFASGLMQIARLIKARVGLEAASINLGGWDSHFTQETLITPLISRLGSGLAAFHRDLGRLGDTTSVVVLTEFGRRVRENASFGTDHGRGGVMFVMGGGVAGGKIHGAWPGLEDEALEDPGDLPVANNYRDILAPVLQRHGAGDTLDRIFPGFALQPLALY